MTIPRAKVFGLGLSKTGTSSLAEALTILNYRTVHNPTDDDTVMALLRGTLRCTALDENDAICDIMFIRYFTVLDRLYPGSRFILTERDKVAWHESCARHWASRRVSRHRLWNEDLVDFNVYGTAQYQYELFEETYELHYQRVTAYFAGREDRLLRFNICAGEGWSVLCNFLGRPVPEKPFPHICPPPWAPPSSRESGFVERERENLPMP